MFVFLLKKTILSLNQPCIFISILLQVSSKSLNRTSSLLSLTFFSFYTSSISYYKFLPEFDNSIANPFLLTFYTWKFNFLPLLFFQSLAFLVISVYHHLIYLLVAQNYPL